LNLLRDFSVMPKSAERAERNVEGFPSFNRRLRRVAGRITTDSVTKAARRGSGKGWSRAGRREAAYLRAAQAYMLISMPTGTSTIFGAFQAI
jgi:hypothetical protein